MNASVVYLEHALLPHKRQALTVTPGPIGQFAPAWRRPYIALLDGAPVLRADWDRPLPAGSLLAFVDVNAIPQGGGDGGSNPLRIIAMLAVMYFAGPIAGQINGALGLGLASESLGFALLKGAVGLVGSALVNALIPPPKPTTPQVAQALAAPSPTYNLQAQGNLARLDAAIPEHFGRLLAYPDLAAQPYAEYAGNEQFLYQLFVIGRGEYDVEAIRIEDTAIDEFDDVEYEVVAPGGTLSLFPSAVTTSVEVAGQDLPTSSAVGAYVANAAGTDANALAIDLVYPRGIYYANVDGSLSSVDIVVQIEVREIDDSGTAIGSWTTLATETVSGATTTPQRRSFRYSVSAGRYEVRLTRTDTEQTAVEYGHDVVWAALRAYLVDDADYGDVTLLAVRMRASSQLSGQAARKVNVIATRKLPAWDGDAWGSATATRSIAWALAYTAQAVGLADAEIDLDGLLALDAVWAARGDYFDGRFDNFLGFWEAMQKIAGAGRARCFLQAGILRTVRDQAQAVPVQLYSMRNIVRGSFSVDYLMPTPETADCIDVSYYDAAVWGQRKVRAALSGSAEDKPAKVDLFGVTAREHAYREGLYQAASNRYRRRMIHFRTEMEGFIPSLGDLIAVQHDMVAWGQGGDVVAWQTDGENQFAYSEAFDDAWWTKLGASITSTTETAPDGQSIACEITEGGGTAHGVRRSLTLAVGSWRMSAWVAPGTKHWIELAAGTKLAYFDVDSGVVGTSSGVLSAGIESWPFGWYRVWIDFSIPSIASLPFYFLMASADGVNSYVGAGDTVRIFGAGLSPLTAAGPYLKTSGAAVSAQAVVTAAEALDWSASGTHYMGLRKPDGSIDGPVAVSGFDRWAVLAAPLTFTPYTGGAMERTHYTFGPGAAGWRQPAVVLSAKPVGDRHVDMLAVGEDDNVHTADEGVTTPTAASSALANYTAAPRVRGLIARSKPGDASIMLLSWEPSPWADHYYVEISSDGANWTRVRDTAANNAEAPALYGANTLARVAAVGLARGAWVQVAYGDAADYMWDAVDTTLMWGTGTDPMWTY